MQQDNQYLIDILNAAQRIQEYTEHTTLIDFYNDVKLQNKVMRRLLSISKAAQRISAVTREDMSAIGWAELIGIKQNILHDNPSVDIDALWILIQQEIPLLVQVLSSLVLDEIHHDFAFARA